MQRNKPELRATEDIRLPVLDGDTLPPKLLGIEGFCRAMEALYPVYPNREALLAKRRSGEHGPVPVRFHVD
ncbi:MAG: hypothetical protein HN380_26285 [Victivallales bacterium]|jgi:hypothetical protein|nr:hypothetical protein [Victivallales bacterium]